MYFTPISGVDSYFIRYGTDNSANQYAASFAYSDTNGAIAYTINLLQPHTTYYFSVRGGNGCATGNWSNILSSTTLRTVVSQNFVSDIIKTVEEAVTPQKKLDIVSSNLTTEKSNVCSYVVGAGDSLWSIALDKLNNGSSFVDIKELNNLNSNSISAGQELKLPCDKQPETIVKAKDEVQQTGVTLDVKVLADNNQPVVGATVTLHSKVQMAKTNKDGVAHFENVEAGEHKVFLAYNGYNGEQKLTVDGTNKEQTLTIQVKMNNGFSSPLVLSVIGIMSGIIIILIFLLIRRHKEKTTNK